MNPSTYWDTTKLRLEDIHCLLLTTSDQLDSLLRMHMIIIGLLVLVSLLHGAGELAWLVLDAGMVEILKTLDKDMTKLRLADSM